MVPHVEQELHTLPAHPSSPSVFSGVRVARSVVFCVMFCRSLFVLMFFLCCCIVSLSDYLFGIFKLFMYTFTLIAPVELGLCHLLSLPNSLGDLLFLLRFLLLFFIIIIILLFLFLLSFHGP